MKENNWSKRAECRCWTKENSYVQWSLLGFWPALLGFAGPNKLHRHVILCCFSAESLCRPFSKWRGSGNWAGYVPSVRIISMFDLRMGIHRFDLSELWSLGFQTPCEVLAVCGVGQKEEQSTGAKESSHCDVGSKVVRWWDVWRMKNDFMSAACRRSLSLSPSRLI